MNIAHHLEVPGLLPFLHRQIEQASARDGAGVVDENSGVWMCGRDSLAFASLRKISRESRDRSDCRQFIARRFKPLGIARNDCHAAAFLQEYSGACGTDSLGATGD